MAGFPEHEVRFMDQLRSIRNKIAYRGFFVTPDFLQRNEPLMKTIVVKLRSCLIEKLKRHGASRMKY